MKDLTLRRYILKTLKLDNYKGDYRLMSQLPKYLNDVLIGVLLSDGCLERPSETSNVRLSINMSFYNFPYIFHLYNLFESYIDTDLKVLDVKSSNNLNISKLHSTVRFKTVSMPLLIRYYNIFYKMDIKENKIKKTIPVELKSCFNAVSLAHLVMGDGNYLDAKNIIRIYTNSFIKNDVILLSNIIYKNLNIYNRVIHDRNDQYIIIIEKENISLVQEIVMPYIHSSMIYKLGLKKCSTSVDKFNYFSLIDDI